MSAASQTLPCIATHTACCTSCAGGRAFITPAIFPRTDLTESTLLDYVRFQSSLQPPPSAPTINDRVACADRAIRNEFPDAPCQAAHGFQQVYLHRRPTGPGPAAVRAQQTARQGTQAYHRPSFGRRSGALLVQLPQRARFGHRGLDAHARTPLCRSHGPEPRRCTALGRTAPRTRQGQQAALPSSRT